MISTNQPLETLTVGAIVWRLILSIFLWTAYALINGATGPVTTIAAGKAAGGQFANDDATNVLSIYGVNLFGHLGIAFWALLLVMVWVWWRPARIGLTALLAAALALVLFVGTPAPVSAYYDKTDWPEIYFILPNESAFWIPDAGANKDSQTQFMSEEYLAANKIAAKRYQIPHTKLTGSSYGFDFFVPAGRLIIVDRAPYSREWTADAKRGTSDGDQAIECQSKEGLDVKIEIAISAAVFENDAAKFLYRFGVRSPAGDRNTPEVKFISVFQGKSLTEVMDTVVHGKIQSLMCSQFSPKTLDQINADAGTLMTESEKVVKEYLIKEFGITLDFIGYAGTFTFGDTVQKAIDDRFAAEKLAPVLATLQARAKIAVDEGLAAGLAKGVPQTLFTGSESWVNVLASNAAQRVQAGPRATPAATAPAPAQ